ncbi:MAG: DUF6067 family protein [Planctomycetota bacterium]|nr:DUF6067 family protein [Planctomycetota bacterium]
MIAQDTHLIGHGPAANAVSTARFSGSREPGVRAGQIGKAATSRRTPNWVGLAAVAALIMGSGLMAAEPPAVPSSPAGTADRGVVLFDFETDDTIALWHNEGQTTLGAGKQLTRVSRFATLGKFSMEFRTPAWKQGSAEWPAFECRPPRTDWTGFDRLVFDASNQSSTTQQLALFISDSKKPTRQGLAHSERLNPRSHTRVVIDLATGLKEKQLNPADIHVLHFFTDRPPSELVVCLDGMLLLRPGEPLPALPEAYFKDFAGMQASAVAELRDQARTRGVQLTQAAQNVPAVAAWVAESLRGLAAKLAELDARTQQGGAQALELQRDIVNLRANLGRLEGLATLRTSFEPTRTSVQTPGSKRDDVVVGFATSMEKVLPRADALPVQTKTRVELSLARGEKESFQVVVVPCRADLKQAQVRVTELRGPDGATFPAGQSRAVPVGYVQTKTVPPYGTSYVGWWPDPILEFMSAADIVEGDAQAFWVRVHAPRDQAAGQYQGKLEVGSQDGSLFTFDLSVRVYNFAVPVASPLPLAVTFAPEDFPTPATGAEQAQWRKEADYPIKAWKKHKLRWADFLADYYLTYDSLYTHVGPDFEAIQRLHQQGRLGSFNLGYYGPCGASPAEVAAWKTGTLERLRRQYDQAKQLDVLKHAYIYGCDENPKELFPGVQRAATHLKAEFPGVLVMTTTYDHSFGLDSEIKAVDAWCPLTPSFHLDKATQSRAAERLVWWYICCGPHHPFANMFVEYPAIEGRLLMGPMTAKYRPDGFLYYQISIWNARRPIASGPFTDWEPRSWTSYHGDGSWTCVGPDGTPLPTIRLENFRDGLEDYAYVRILEHVIQRLKSQQDLSTEQKAWLEEAQAALQVPDSLVKTMAEYSRDPAQVYAYRNRLGDLIDRAGQPDADPWGPDFGVRGFSRR